MASWLIGGATNNDLVIDVPTVSAHHCCLLRSNDGEFFLEDLGSTNGTYVNGRRIEQREQVTAEDIITLGEKTRMPWPQTPATLPQRTISIGSAADNDLIIDKATVSRHHAQLSVFPNHLEVEDLGSANGTFLRNHDNPIKWAVMTLEDPLFLGSYQLPRAGLGQMVGCDDPPAVAEVEVVSAAGEEGVPTSPPQAAEIPPPEAPPSAALELEADRQNGKWPVVPQGLEMPAEEGGRLSSPKGLHPLINALGFIIFSLGGLGLGYLIARWLGIW